MAAGRSNPKHTRRRKQRGPSAATVISLLVCVVCFGAAFLLWNAALSGVDRNETGESFRPVVGDPPYRVCVDAGHGGSDPGARGVVEEKEMTARTSEALLALLEADSNYIPLRSRERYDITAKPSERAESINAQSPQLLLSIHGNSAPEGSAASGFECYPSVPGRTWHQESYYFAQQLSQGMGAAGARLRGHGGIRYIYYQGEAKQLVESTYTEVRGERSFTLLEDVNCPAVLAEQCFVTSEESEQPELPCLFKRGIISRKVNQRKGSEASETCVIRRRQEKGASVFEIYIISYNAGYTKYRGVKKPSFPDFGPFQRLLSLLGWLDHFFAFGTVLLFNATHFICFLHSL